MIIGGGRRVGGGGPPARGVCGGRRRWWGAVWCGAAVVPLEENPRLAYDALCNELGVERLGMHLQPQIWNRGPGH